MNAQRRLTSNPGLKIRMFVTMSLLLLVYLVFLAFLSSSGVSTGGLIVIAGLMMGGQYFFSDRLALRSMRAKVVTEAEEPELHRMVARLSERAGIPKPRVAVSDLPIPNAFATGRNRATAVVAVTRELTAMLTPEELEGVVGHELTHVVNRDVAVMTIASFFSTLAFFVMRSWMFMGMGRRRSNNDGAGPLMIYLVSLVVWLISQLLILGLSRHREFAADRGACILTNNPRAMASALVKISGGRVDPKVAAAAGRMNAFFIVGVSARELFSSHPSTERRLENIAHVAAELGV